MEETAVISPINAAADYENAGARVTQLSDGFFPAYRIEKDGVKFTSWPFRSARATCAKSSARSPVRCCKNIVFTGTVGAIREEFGIGDIVLPRFSVSGDGAVRYFTKGSLTENKNTFGMKFYPDGELAGKLREYLAERGVK